VPGPADMGAILVKSNGKRPDRTSASLPSDLRQIIDTIPAFVWGASADGSIAFLNQRGLAYIGFSLEQLRGWNWKDLNILHPDDVEGLFDAWRAIVASGQEGEIQARMRRFDGEYKWFLFRVAPLHDRSGQVVAWLGVDVEIDARKRAEDELRRSQSYMAEAQKLSQTGSFGWKPHTGELIWSAETYCILGYDRETKPTLELALQRVHPEDLAFVKEALDRASHDGRGMDFENRLLFPDGSLKHVHAMAHAVRDGLGNLEFVGAIMDVTAYKSSQQALEHALQETEVLRAQFERAIDTIPGLVWSALPDGDIDYLNERWREYTGMTNEQACGWGWRAAIHPEDLAGLESYWRSVLASGTPGQTIARLRRFDGVFRWFLFRGVPLHDETGKLIKWYGQTTDIDDRKRAEEELQRSEAYLAEAQRLSLTGSFGWKVQTGELFWSKETFCILGFDPETKPVLDLVFQRVHPADLTVVREAFEFASRNGRDMNFEHRLLFPDGSVKYVHVMGYAVRNGTGNLEFVGAISDITATKLAEEKLRRNEDELRRVVDLVPQIIFVIGPDGKALYGNRVALDYAGIRPEHFPFVGFGGRLSHPEDVAKYQTIRQQSLARGLPFELEQRMLDKHGNYRWFLFRYNPMKDEQGNPVRWYVTATDIEERRQAEERVHNENLALRDEIERTSMFEEIVGSSQPLQTVLRIVSRVAPTDSTVLLLGETGTGKELIARAIYKRSTRNDRAFIRVNCAAIPVSLIASELFGHEKGAFTGALDRRVGRFESANGGTIFLDEIGDLPAETQVALLRVLQERELERVGSNKPIPVDVRVLAATSRDLEAAVAAGTFRQDLFYRLNVFPIHIPPLRDRVVDIPLLAEYFIDRYARKICRKIGGIEKRTLELFQAYEWPGNIREFQNVIERAVVLCEGETFSVDPSWIKQESSRAISKAVPFTAAISERARELAQHEREMIEAALAESRGRISGPSGAAAKLGIPRQTLEYKIRSLGINKHGVKTAATR